MLDVRGPRYLCLVDKDGVFVGVEELKRIIEDAFCDEAAGDGWGVGVKVEAAD